ncbi:MaoC like domain [Cedecea neteri]|uniref:MaoC like domain n=1 Tax=Cedecea neteri TaxID=158822 RepID=A0A291DRZ0_9ENTR|nr:MaoC/PaaZ C-terminal domain-containing protein [Cedecea neteri]ATF90585.1 hypothetical protein CO704_00065 [Cedecea neteri]SQA98789.1 MaoC like domain [Cedecea neteri]
MKKMIYDCGHGQRWANFSGDYNPIHFDLTAAAELNQAALIAHGMRVIADVKNHLFFQEEKPNHQYDGTIRFSAKFEKPVLCGTQYKLINNADNTKTTFKLVDCSTDISRIRGSVSQATLPEISDLIAEEIVTSDCQNDAAERWPAEIERRFTTFLSSVMFRALFNTPDLFHEHMPVHSLSELLSKEKVLQTHYELYCNALLLHRKEQSIEGLSICIGKPFITGDANYGWVIQVQVAAKEDETTLMHISVTLKVTTN